MRRSLLLATLVLAACGKDGRHGVLTPEDVAAASSDGDAVIVEGTVHTLTFDDVLGADDLFTPLPDRWLLIRTVVPPHVTLDDLDSGNVLPAWGLGVLIRGDALAAAPLPQIGDRVHVTGTFGHAAWAGFTVPVVEDATIEILETTTTLGVVGDTCGNDLDCHDRLVCDRATTTCVVPEPIVWGSDWRNLNGTCVADADCPLGQRCDTTYVTPLDGDFAPAYYLERDAGKSLCVPDDGATLAELCPRILTPADVSGGRFVAGKEVCVRATNWLSVNADDRDTHVQMALDEPLPYPAADTAYYIFGSTSENAPMYKDPSRPQGAVADPGGGDVTVAIGTIRYDDSHGWWEIHPIKAQFAESSGKGVRALQRRWKTHPGAIDLEDLERTWGKGERDLEPATARPR
jgi:hypothetical protein